MKKKSKKKIHLRPVCMMPILQGMKAMKAVKAMKGMKAQAQPKAPKPAAMKAAKAKAAKAAAEAAAAADAGAPPAASPAADAGASTAEASGAGAAAGPRPVELQFDSAALGQAFKLLSPEELQAATLAAFYAHVKVEKTAAEIDEILSKRRVAGSSGKGQGYAKAAAAEHSLALGRLRAVARPRGLSWWRVHGVVARAGRGLRILKLGGNS